MPKILSNLEKLLTFCHEHILDYWRSLSGYQSIFKPNFNISDLPDLSSSDLAYLTELHSYLLSKSSSQFTGDDDSRSFLFRDEFHKYPRLNCLINDSLSSVNTLSKFRQECSFVVFGETVATISGLGSGGGWHRDSFNNQIKTMYYLSNVTTSNGPFQIIPNTKNLLSILNSSCLKNFYRIKSLSAHEQSNVLEIIGPAGKGIVFNPMNIHRGKPLAKGTRKTVTMYFYPKFRSRNAITEFRSHIRVS